MESNYLELWNDHIKSLQALRWNLEEKSDFDKLANIEIALKSLAKKADTVRKARERQKLANLEEKYGRK